MTRPDPPTTVLAGVFAVSGVIHLVRPQIFEPIVPAPLSRHRRELVLASGVAELACAAGLIAPATRSVAGWSSAALLAGVFPANLQMTLDHGRRAQRKRTTPAVAAFAGTVARLPVQWPLIRIALRAGRGG